MFVEFESLGDVKIIVCDVSEAWDQERIRNNPGKQETNSEKFEKIYIRRPHVVWPGGSVG